MKWKAAAIVAVMLGAAVVVLALTPGALTILPVSLLKLHAPDWSVLVRTPFLVKFHLATVGYGVVGGLAQFLLPKGTPLHRLLGWVWLIAMAATSVATLFIRDMNHGSFSPIHIFSAMTLLSLPVAVYLARTNRIVAHAWAMSGIYIGLLIAGATAFAPGRVMFDLLFHRA